MKTKLVLAFFTLAITALALDWGYHTRGNLTVYVIPYTSHPFPNNPSFPKVDIEKHGVMVGVRTKEPQTIAFRVTVNVLTDAGQLSQTRVIGNEEYQGQMDTVFFLFEPRLKEVLSVKVEELTVTVDTEF